MNLLRDGSLNQPEQDEASNDQHCLRCGSLKQNRKELLLCCPISWFSVFVDVLFDFFMFCSHMSLAVY